MSAPPPPTPGIGLSKRRFTVGSGHGAQNNFKIYGEDLTELRNPQLNLESTNYTWRVGRFTVNRNFIIVLDAEVTAKSKGPVIGVGDLTVTVSSDNYGPLQMDFQNINYVAP